MKYIYEITRDCKHWRKVDYSTALELARKKGHSLDAVPEDIGALGVAHGYMLRKKRHVS